jgi:hypothetical protein
MVINNTAISKSSSYAAVPDCLMKSERLMWILRNFITINNKKSDYADMMDIAYVEVVNDKNVPVSKAIEVVPSYQTDRSAAYEVRWKNLKAANVKSGTVKLRVYLEGNNPKWKKPNATLSLKVNIK